MCMPIDRAQSIGRKLWGPGGSSRAHSTPDTQEGLLWILNCTEAFLLGGGSRIKKGDLAVMIPGLRGSFSEMLNHWGQVLRLPTNPTAAPLQRHRGNVPPPSAMFQN